MEKSREKLEKSLPGPLPSWNNTNTMASGFTGKGGVICSGTLLALYVPTEYQDRAALWNAVEKVE